MITQRAAQQLFAELGPQSQEILTIVHDGECSWGIHCEHDVMLHAELDEERDLFVFRSFIGEVPSDAPAEFYRAALSLNFVNHQQGGSLLAQDASDGELVTFYEIRTSMCDPSTLVTIIENLTGITKSWEQVIDRLSEHRGSDSDITAAPQAGDRGVWA